MTGPSGPSGATGPPGASAVDADRAPGRVALLLSPPAHSCGETCDPPAGPTALAQTPGGGLAVGGFEYEGRPPVVVELTSTGALATSFGHGGVRQFTGSLGTSFQILQILARAGGGLLLIGQTPRSDASGRSLPGWLTVVALNADGSLEATFGTGGTVTLSGLGIPLAEGYQFSGVPGADFGALNPQGNLVIAATTTSTFHGVPPAHFVIVRLNAAGRLDRSFAGGGVADAGSGSGRQATVLSDGSIAALGSTSSAAAARGILVKLTGAGAPDPQFAGQGDTVLAPGLYASQLAVAADGSLLVLGAADAGKPIVVARYTPDGRLDGAFGPGGVVALPQPPGLDAQLLVLADGSSVVLMAADQPPTRAGIVAMRLTSTGALVTPHGEDLRGLGFGGGGVGMVSAVNGDLTSGDSDFGAQGLISRVLPDGSIAIAAPVQAMIDFDFSRGLLEGWGIAELTPRLAPASGFGAPTPPRLAVAPAPAALPATTPTTPATRVRPSCWVSDKVPGHLGAIGLRLLVSSSQPGGVAIEVRSRGQLIAQGSALVTAQAANPACIQVIASRSRLLTGVRSLPVAIRLTARDLAGNRTTVMRHALLGAAQLRGVGYPT